MAADFPPAERILHPAVEEIAGAVLDQVRLTDRQRVGVLLQGAALLAHLEHGGWRLASDWEGARVTPQGLLCVPGIEAGRSSDLPQVKLSRLIASLFSTRGEVAGRGEARRAVRSVFRQWRQRLTPVPPDEAVGQVLEAAPFLWQKPFGPARGALVAEHRRRGNGEAWVAGPGRCRRRLLAVSRDRKALEELLASDEARELWEGDAAGADPLVLASAGRWRAAVRAWEGTPPRSSREKVELARALVALGKFEKALATLRGQTAARSRILRVHCQYQLGRLGAAKATLRCLESVALSPAELLELAEVAVRVEANAGNPQAVRDWVARALAASRGRLQARARLLAASAAWDLGETGRMERHLDAARRAQQDPDLAWRYHQARGLQAMAAADGPAIVDHLSRALASSRRCLRTFEAGRLWNDLAVGRVQADDLPGAERACRHVLRLLGGCDGPLSTTLALYNLAEVRLRRGRLAGVREILESSSRENRLAGNLRGAAQDAELWARFELVRGNAEAALEHCREALARLEEEGVDWHRAELHLFAARALGWLGRRDEAATELAHTTPEALVQLEPEERPAPWALAGEVERARRGAQGSRFQRLWERLLGGGSPPPSAWDRLEGLEPYRAARLVLDCALARPGGVPPSWLRRAIETFQGIGAEALAAKLDAQLSGPWRALEAYLTAEPREPQSVAALFATAGYPEVRLVWRAAAEERQLVPGVGGDEEVSAPHAGGRLILQAPRVDKVVRALFAATLRQVNLVPESQVPPTSAAIVGESASLKAALLRIARLAPEGVPVLIEGETGTGKELVAREIHRLSPRSGAPFLPVNCAALSETLLLSDLFGHVRGAFTSADRDRAGVFESARGGTVFLDEIGDLPAAAQGMLLRVLQEGEVRRVGESHPRRVDVRVVAATHRELARMVEEERFRKDLFYRLNVARVRLPPLRDRGLDIVLLAEHFLARRGGGTPSGLTLSPEGRGRLMAHTWPGNIRELKNVLEVAAALALAGGNGTIRAEHLDLPELRTTPGGPYHEQVDAFRRRLIKEALGASNGKRAEAARRLGLSRQALSYLVRQLGIL